MIVPQYWAEGRLQQQVGKRQVTLRRFGWSDESQAAAQILADQRVREAMARFIAGEKLPRREPKTAYNGAQGVPIREEIVARHGQAIITRNGYGARCLNHPGVLFADIDFAETWSASHAVLLFFAVLLAVLTWWFLHGRIGAGPATLAAMIALCLVSVLGGVIFRPQPGVQKGEEATARTRVDNFMASHPAWSLRLYRTPAGYRLLALHRIFDPSEPAVTEFFDALGVDRVYARMCQNQHCFRARVSPKPWRAGINDHIKPRPGTWPVALEKLPERLQWINRYEKASERYAACRFVTAMGSGQGLAEALAVQALHDELCRATSNLPIA